jgi:hypothetical protein
MTSQALVVNPRTGELVPVDAPTDVIADIVDALEERVTEIRAMQSDLRAVLLNRMDQSARWTHHVELDGRKYKLEAPSPTAGTTEYDAQALRDGLDALAFDGVLDPAAVDAAAEVVRPDPYVKVNHAGVGRLLKLGDQRVTAVIEAARRVVPVGSRSVRVKRVAP